MRQHKISRYKDGYKWVDYCQLCMLEGAMLAEACEPRPTKLPTVSENIKEKFVSGLPDKIDK